MNEARAVSEEPYLEFPRDFLWGVSTAAHQVEGDNQNQWSDWERAGRIKSGESCGKACDWWENAERDFDIARDLGLKALRLSLEWSRIEPEEGRFDLQALQRYRQMLQALHERGIEPIVCLHHFTNPRWFEQQGAFLQPDAPQLFERFTREVAQAVGDLCRFWVTFNEPNVYAACGYVLGEFPPGRKGHLLDALRVNRAQAQAHALAYRTLHSLVPQSQVGWAQHYVVCLRAEFSTDGSPARWTAFSTMPSSNSSNMAAWLFPSADFPDKASRPEAVAISWA